jgi:DNA repair ATPase RecN
LPAELNNKIRNKDDMLTNVKNLLYRCSDDMELLAKQLEDADVQLVECMEQIRDMAAEKELKDKELEELKGAAQVVVDMVDPPEEGVVNNKIVGAPS